MIYLFVLFLTATGFGFLIESIFKTHFSIGLRLALGLQVLPILILLLAASGLDNLSLSYSVAAAISFVGLLLNWRKINTQLFLHPTFLLTALIIIIFSLGFINYTPHKWDEFSHWALMPKQMFYFNHLADMNFPFKTFITYTPGWPIILIYPLCLLNSAFDESQLILAAYFSSILVLGVLFDLLHGAVKKQGYSHATLLLFAAFILIIAARLNVFPNNILIETVLQNTLLILFIVAMLRSLQLLPDKELIIAITLLTCSAYLYKSSMAVLFVSSLIYLAFELRKSTQRLYGLLPLAAGLFIFWLWQMYTSEFAEFWLRQSTSLPKSMNELFLNRAPVILVFLWASIKYIIRDLHIYLPVFLAFTWVKTKIKPTSAVIYITSTLAIYLIGVLGLYLFVLSDFESSRLASFKRYVEVMAYPIKVIGLSYIGLQLLNGEFGRKIDPVIQYFSLPVQKVNKYATFLLLGCLFTSLAVNLKIPLLQNSHLQALKVKDILSSNNSLGANVFFISQTDYGLDYLVAKYASFGSQVYYRLPEPPAYTTIFTDDWHKEVTSEEFSVLLKKYKFIWINKSDKWLEDQILKNYPEMSCPRNSDILLNTSSEGAAQCIAL